MTNAKGSTSMIATNRLHRPFDNNRVAFIALRPDGSVPDMKHIARHLTRQFNFPFVEEDIAECTVQDREGEVPSETTLSLTGRLDGSVRIYFYGKATGSKDAQIDTYIQAAAKDLVLHGLKNETQWLIDRAMRMAFGIEFGTRYENPQCAHFQLHYLGTHEAERTLEQAAANLTPWNVSILLHNVRAGTIEHQIYTIFPRNDFWKP